MVLRVNGCLYNLQNNSRDMKIQQNQMNKEQNRRRLLFEEAVKSNLPEYRLVFPNSKGIYGRVLEQDGNKITWIGMKNKKYRIYRREVS